MRKAFTLPELLIAVTLSAILMTGLLAFLGSGIGNAWKLRKQATESVTESAFDRSLSLVRSMGKAQIVASGSYSGAGYGSGVLLFQSGSNEPLSFIWVRTRTGVCANSATLSGVQTEYLVLSRTETPYFSGTSGTYSLSGNTLLNNGVVIIWDDFSKVNSIDIIGTDPDNVSLLHPKGVLEAAGGVFIADTGNSRILSFIWGKVYPLVSSEAGILHPSILYASGSGIGAVGTNSSVLIKDAGTCSTTTLPDFHGALDIGASYDTVSISPDTTGTALPTSTGAYVFDSTNPTTVSTTGNGVSLTYSGGILANNISISGIALSSVTIGAHYLSLEFFSAGVSVGVKNFPLIECSNGVLPFPDGNTVSTQDCGLYSNAWGTPYNFSTFTGSLAWSESAESIHPVSDVQFIYSPGMLTLTYLEYTDFDCINENHARRERIIKIPLQ